MDHAHNPTSGTARSRYGVYHKWDVEYKFIERLFVFED